ncbi:aggregation-promoting factor C-terminal-like domain-containing protein [Angustibacter peucedani]
MIRRALRRPLLSSMTALAATAAVAGGVAVSADDPSQAASPSPQMRAAADSTPEPTLQDPRSLAARKRVRLEAAEHRADLAHAKKVRLAKIKAARERAAERERASRARERARLLSADPRSAAKALLGDYGFGADQFGCLDSLWTKESGWNYQASNPSSGAYGIPQALPGGKMASVGSDWRTNPVTQIKWGLQYIRASYGSPCAAWGHSQSNGWY